MKTKNKQLEKAKTTKPARLYVKNKAEAAFRSLIDDKPLEDEEKTSASSALAVLGLSSDLQHMLINQILPTFKGCQTATGHCDSKDLAKMCMETVAVFKGIAPKNELESLLVAQMLGVHNLAMMTMGRAMITDQIPEGVDANINRATKLLRVFMSQIETLTKYRSGGTQRMKIEHVHINEGGQAVIGNMNTREG
jgi:hypothetical protein